MRIVAGAVLALALTIGGAWADEDITDQVQQMSRFSDQQQKAQEQQRYQQYLRESDSANGVSQRTGPSGGLTRGGAYGGWQWSTP